jgi:hypothetical protein
VPDETETTFTPCCGWSLWNPDSAASGLIIVRLSQNVAASFQKIWSHNSIGPTDAERSNARRLYSFTGGSDGGKPLAGLILSGDALFGTTPAARDELVQMSSDFSGRQRGMFGCQATRIAPCQNSFKMSPFALRGKCPLLV